MISKEDGNYKEHERGYQAFYAGVIFNSRESYYWQEGWYAGSWQYYLENSNLKDSD